MDDIKQLSLDFGNLDYSSSSENLSLDLQREIETHSNISDADQYTNEIPIPEVSNDVKIVLPSNKESETYQHLHYYYSHLLKKVGQVQEVKLYPSGKYTCTVNFHGQILQLHPENLLIIY